MPIMYVNPAPRRGRRIKRRVRRVKPLGGVTLSRRRKAKRNPSRRKRVTTAASSAKKGTKSMAKRRRRRRKNPPMVSTKKYKKGWQRTFGKKKRSGKKAKRKGRGKSAKSAAAKKAAATRAAKKAARSRAAKKAARTRKRRGTGRKAAARRTTTRKRRRTRRPGAKRRTGVKALARARRSIKRAKRRGGLAGAYARRFKMRTNPRRRRSSRRRRRRNPSPVGGLMKTPSMLMGAVKAAVPVAASLYLTRFLIAKVGPSIPMVDRLGRFQKPAVAGLAVVAANIATKRGPLAKYRSGIMLGTSLNLVDALVSAFAPDSVKGMFGLGDGGYYDQALAAGEFVTTSDYLEVGDEPIDDDIALSDYVETSGVEEELGAIQEELGVEEELGSTGPRRLGGVSQGSMLRALRSSSSVGVIPTRSFVKQVPAAGPGYDNPAALYTGIFGGGF